MNIYIRKFLLISISALAGVSCSISPIYPPQPGTVPIERQEKIPSKIDKPLPQIQSKAIPLSPRPTVKLTPPVGALLPASLLSLRNIPTVPGGIAWVTLSSLSSTPPKVRYQKRQVMILRHGQKWVALVGVPLKAKVGLHYVIDQQTGKRYSFRVKYKKYKTQRLRIKNKRKVNPNSRDMVRIEREYKQIRAALASPWQTTLTSPLPLIQPVKGRLSSPFGLRRYLNGQPRSPHKGLDIAASLGTPVVAAATGRIVNTGHYFFTGKTIFIDHGQSVVTLYGHMDTIAVSAGQMVEKGQFIGTVGKTGRATGPHLHWGVSLNNTMIDPMLVKQ